MARSETLVKPIIHSNGTSREALLDGACEVGRALRGALGALTKHAPNQRDYYPDPSRWPLALAMYERRVKTVKALYDEMQCEALWLSGDEEDA
jgi:hypothetical protein